MKLIDTHCHLTFEQYKIKGVRLSYAKIRMKTKTFESRVFEMECSSLKTEY